MTQEKVWTVLELLRWTTSFFQERGIETARLDAECLLAHALGCERLALYVEFEKPVLDEERTKFRELVRRRAEDRVPVAQLLGSREFWSLPITVTADVLVPRPETECLVSAALDAIPDREAEIRILDLGTGSGAVALALASELPKARIIATDVSAAALAVARENADRLGFADRVRLLEGDGFEPVAGEHFDLLVSNPPYVAETAAAELPPELAHEPAGALFAGADGTRMLKRIAAEAAGAIEPGGVVAVELGPEQAEAMQQWLTEAGFVETAILRDLAERPRVVRAKRG